jgi:2-(1,2-epoxy-1,2-dihydrophenyl)acetyl-CoA isomerase
MPKAKELALLGEIIDAPEALAIGLVNRVVPLEELDAAVDAWAQQLATGPTLALSMTKRLLNDSASASMYEALEDEGRTQAVNFSTADTIESVTAFLQKREPNYRAR